jgi:hypothetical protein
MPWFISFLIYAALFAVNRLLYQPPRISKRPFDVPKIDEGTIIPVFWGTGWLAPSIVWWGDTSAPTGDDGYTAYFARAHMVFCWGTVDELMDLTFDGKSIRQASPGYWNAGIGQPTLYHEDLYGPIWPRFSLTRGTVSSTDLIVASLSMFGGEAKEGGVAGPVKWFWGDDNHTASNLLTTKYGYDLRYMGLTHATFGVAESDTTAYDNHVPDNGLVASRNFHWANNVAIMRPVQALMRRTPNSPTIGQSAADANMGYDANPAEVIWDILTNTRYGLGWSEGLINLASFQAAALRLKNEQMGLSPFAAGEAAEDVIGDILQAIDGVLRVNPTTTQIELKLARDDYTLASLLTVDHTNIRDLNMSRTQMKDTSNEVQVKFRELGNSWGIWPTKPVVHIGTTSQVLTTSLSFPFTTYAYLVGPDRHIQPDSGTGLPLLTFNGVSGTLGVDFDVDYASGIFIVYDTAITAAGQTVRAYYRAQSPILGFRESSTLAQNLANQQATGSVRRLVVDMPFITKYFVANMVAQRLLRAQSMPLAKFTWKMNKTGYSLSPGDVVKLNWTPLGISNLAVRITEVDYGELENGELSLSGIEDVFGQPAARFVTPPPSGWNEPDQPPDDSSYGYGYNYGLFYGGQYVI